LNKKIIGLKSFDFNWPRPRYLICGKGIFFYLNWTLLLNKMLKIQKFKFSDSRKNLQFTFGITKWKYMSKSDHGLYSKGRVKKMGHFIPHGRGSDPIRIFFSWNFFLNNTSVQNKFSMLQKNIFDFICKLSAVERTDSGKYPDFFYPSPCTWMSIDTRVSELVTIFRGLASLLNIESSIFAILNINLTRILSLW